MNWIKVCFWVLPQRLRSTWMLLAITSFGILAATTLMALSAIYSRALAEGGLRHSIASSSQSVLNTQIIVQNRPLGLADYQGLQIVVEETAQNRLGHILRDTQRFGRTPPNMPVVSTADGKYPIGNYPLGRTFFLTGFEKHSRVIEGRWPQSVPILHNDGVDLEVVVGKRIASAMSLEVGSQLYLLPFVTNPSERIAIKVVGLVEPLDPQEEYWMDRSSTYFNGLELGEQFLASFYVPEAAFFGGLGIRYPSLVANYGWFLFLDTSMVTAATVEPTSEAMAGLETDLNKRFPRSLVLSGLNSILPEYEKDLVMATVPIRLFISLVVVVMLYFLAMVMGLLIRTRSDEASLLTSRGASVFQVSTHLALGEGIMVLVATALGPFLALGIMQYWLVRTINPVGQGNSISIGLSLDMFVMALVGGLLSLVVLLSSATGLARLGVVEALRLRARPPTLPFLQRYYIDLLVLVMVGLLWWQIQDRGGVIERGLVGRALEVDTSLLLGPVLVLVAAALLVLRLLPLLVRGLAWAFNLIGPVWAVFAITRIERDPIPHGSLLIILMMATALGVFGATFHSTLSRSQEDQALYQLGGELVIKSAALSSSTESELATLPGVQAVTAIGRESVTLLDGVPDSTATFLTVDPYTLDNTIWFRDDFAGKPLAELLSPLQQKEGFVSGSQSIRLPEGTERVGIWVNVDYLNEDRFRRKLTLWMRVSDAEGGYRNLLLGDLPSPMSTEGGSSDQDWTYLEGSLPLDQPLPRREPFRVVAIYIGGGSSFKMQGGSMRLDDITAYGASHGTDGIVVEGFEAPGIWAPLPNAGIVSDTLDNTSKAARTGLNGLAFTWQESMGGTVPGIVIPPGPFPLPVIGGPMFHVGQELRINTARYLVPTVVIGVTDYFPTISNPANPFILVSGDDYWNYLEHIYGPRQGPPQEFWVSLEDTADRSQTILSMRERLPRSVFFRDRESVIDIAQRNPMAGGGWIGLTIISMSALTVAIVLALGTYAVFSVQSGSLDLIVLRAMGFSKLHLLLSLALERILVAIIGIASGSIIGIWLVRWVLGFLDITSSGRPLLPPMIVTVHGGLLVLLAGALVSSLLVATVFAFQLVGKLSASDILRTGK